MKIADALEKWVSRSPVTSLQENTAIVRDHIVVLEGPNPKQYVAGNRAYSIVDGGTSGTSILTATGSGGSSLDVFNVSAATASLYIVRNAELLTGFPTAKPFVYTTDVVAVGEWARPVIDPEVLLTAPHPIPGDSVGRPGSLVETIGLWLTTLVENGPADLTIRCSYVFDPASVMPTSMRDLGNCTVVPICFLPGTVVSPRKSGNSVDPKTTAKTLADFIDLALPKQVRNHGAGVLLEITGFTHSTAAASGDSIERVVLRLKGLWIPITAVSKYHTLGSTVRQSMIAG
jgi:hypothetical protein